MVNIKTVVNIPEAFFEDVKNKILHEKYQPIVHLATKDLQDFEYNPISLKRNPFADSKRRLESITEGYLFLVDALVPWEKKEVLQKYAKNLLEYHSDRLTQGNEKEILLQTQKKNIAVITAYTADLIASLIYEDIFEIKPTEVAKLLDLAEQCSLWVKGRSNVVSLCEVEVKGRNYYPLQIDENISPMSEPTLSELKTIKALNVRRIPDQLTERKYSRLYDSLNPKSYDSITQLEQTVNGYKIDWNEIQKDSNVGNQLANIINPKATKPLWFLEFNEKKKKFFAELCSEPTIMAINEKFKKFGNLAFDLRLEQNFSKITELPQWWINLAERQRGLLAHALRHINDLDHPRHGISSRLRLMPMPANLMLMKSGLIYSNNSQWEVIYFKERIRVAHLGSRDTETLPPEIAELHMQRNLNKIIEVNEKLLKNKKFNIVSLITPNKFFASACRLANKRFPDPFLDNLLNNALDRLPPDVKKRVNKINHPVNYGRYFYIMQTAAYSAEAYNILYSSAEDIFSDLNSILETTELPKDSAKLFEAVDTVKSTLNAIQQAKLSLDSKLTARLNTIKEEIISLQLVEKFQDLAKKRKEGLGEKFKKLFLDGLQQLYSKSDDVSKDMWLRVIQYADKLPENYEKISDVTEFNLLLNKINQQIISPPKIPFIWEASYFTGVIDQLRLFAKQTTNQPLNETLAVFSNIFPILCEYHKTLTDFGITKTFSVNGREMRLSALPQAASMYSKDRTTVTMCMSAKDRSTCSSGYAFAMNTICSISIQQGEPAVPSEANADFIHVLARIYLSGHGGSISEINAPGARGTKYVETYWEQAISEEIKKTAGDKSVLEYDDHQASLNDIHKLMGGNFNEVESKVYEHEINRNYYVCLYTALLLPPAEVPQFLNLFGTIFGELIYWRERTKSWFPLKFFEWVNTNPPSPAGIKGSRDALYDPKLCGLEKIVNIFYKIACRDKTSTWRDRDTSKMYDAVHELFKSAVQKNVQEFNLALTKLKKILEEMILSAQGENDRRNAALSAMTAKP